MKAENADYEREEKEENHNRPVVMIFILLLFGPQVISRMHCKHKRCSTILQPGNLGVQHLPLKENLWSANMNVSGNVQMSNETFVSVECHKSPLSTCRVLNSSTHTLRKVVEFCH